MDIGANLAETAKAHNMTDGYANWVKEVNAYTTNKQNF